MSNPTIFISYRRSDSASEAGRLYLSISKSYSKDSVFMDTSSIEPGTEWPQKITNSLESATVIILIIGPEWIRAADEFGCRKIDNEDDWIRREIEYGIANNKKILPVLVNQAKMPPPDKLPSAVASITNRQAIEIRTDYWDHDIKSVLEQLESAVKNSSLDRTSSDRTSISTLIQEARAKISANIRAQCERMRILTMNQPAEIGGIYTDVNILEKVTRKQRREVAKLLGRSDLEALERIGLSKVIETKSPALEVVKRHSKLLILGKPGSGKTTFLRYLALQCIEGEVMAEHVPFFCNLKEFSESANRVDLLQFITDVFQSRGLGTSETGKLIENGRLLILLDGWDEVSERKNKDVIKEIKEFSDEFNKNIFIVTCRIAAQDYLFENFTEVEIADFDSSQVHKFAAKWFRSGKIKAETFIDRLEANSRIRELASNPLLLTLLCLIFEDSGDFPANRSELYKEGLDILLKKWDATRGIQRAQIYKNLSSYRKEDLLSKLAFDTFLQEDYFFSKDLAEQYIRSYIRNLSDANKPSETLQLDSEAVLKSIEAQHGLLVARAHEIYSFSHLSFHEYFTARELVFNENLAKEKFSELSIHLCDKRWREIFLLTSGMLRSADGFMLHIKQKIDILTAKSQGIQSFLRWIHQASVSLNYSVENEYSEAAVRSYFLTFGHDLTLAAKIDTKLTVDGGSDLARHMAYSLKSLKASLVDIRNLYASVNECCLNISSQISLTKKIVQSIERNASLSSQLKQLKARPDYLIQAALNVKHPKDIDNIHRWWKTQGNSWAKKLKEILNAFHEYQSSISDWQFFDLKEPLFMQYYYANCLLIDCLNSGCYVSVETRSRIYHSLLLPYGEIDK